HDLTVDLVGGEIRSAANYDNLLASGSVHAWRNCAKPADPVTSKVPYTALGRTAAVGEVHIGPP
ncbi:hypothetical protein BaRGS_00031073, partial [Batillaria attramentaria]